MHREAVGVGAGVAELVRIAHADQVGRDNAANRRDCRHHIAPQIGRGRVAVQEQKFRALWANDPSPNST